MHTQTRHTDTYTHTKCWLIHLNIKILSPFLHTFRSWTVEPHFSTKSWYICNLPPRLLFLAVAPSAPRSPSLSTPFHLGYRHGPLSEGAVPQLHDCLNHRAADVAAGENLSGLNNGAKKVLSSPGSREVEGSVWREASMVTVGLIQIFVFTSFHSFSLWSPLWSRAAVVV